MRISTAQLHQQGANAILDNQSRMARTQMQLTTGRRILAPSDDPAGAGQVLRLTEAVVAAEQYRKNADAARSRLEIEEGVLAQTTDMLQRARELAVQGLNGTNGASSRAKIATEIRQILGALVGAANSTDQNGDYLFAGYYQGTTLPFVDSGGGNYVYNGDQGQRLLQVSDTLQVADGDPGSEVFFGVPLSAGGTSSVFEILDSFAATLEANNPLPASLNDIDNALDRLLTARARVGARMNTIESTMEANAAATTTLQGTLSEIRDLDYAEAVTRLNRELTGLQAAQQTYAKVQQLSLFDYL
jgi:flagellar hook-associated protein 3 FlgL